ncbi:hypothetical protein EDC52_101778 [Biostraticola tofi]|uniref:Uncharacterized protein n=1 Tax=Biostraticola tofi TaxID=466109 RepID=A0A4R3Z522_9GAMM|nr:hypothetical protein EDC52_101778 [Biostraticola tofi]
MDRVRVKALTDTGNMSKANRLDVYAESLRQMPDEIRHATTVLQVGFPLRRTRGKVAHDARVSLGWHPINAINQP